MTKKELTRTEERCRERILAQPRPTKVRESSSAVVLKEGDLFLLSDGIGDVPKRNVHAMGLFFRDTRYLDQLELRLDGLDPVLLSIASGHGSETRHHLANPELRGAPKDTVAIVRERLMKDDVLYELVTVTNYGRDAARFAMTISFGASFHDLFSVKGFMPPRAKRLPPVRVDSRTVRLAAKGIDGATRTTTIELSRAPDELAVTHARFDLRLAATEVWTVGMVVEPRIAGEERDAHETAHFDGTHISALLRERRDEWLGSWARCTSSDPLFDAVLERGLRDLRLLRSVRRDRHFVAAGVPWFATLFGRDSAIAGIQTLAYGHRIARETLEILAELQATERDAYRDAEPGKILHELRSGPLARAKKIPQSPAYYGTVDATLLFLILLDEHLRWTGDVDLARRLLPNARAALEWSHAYADHDGDGFLDYAGQYENGLVNQGWKDSGTAIVNADGSLPTPPIALCEVQSYAYRAWQAGVNVLRMTGEAGADELEGWMHDLRERFERRYWSDELGCYVLALQRDGRPCAVVTSNTGQVLWGGIASPERAARVVERLMRDDMWSGWGIRTLSSDARAYNPMSYHLGSVWPHDNALIATGFRRYGHDEAAATITQALLDAAAGMQDYRMPELYSGFPRRSDEQAPVGYPVACSPQAWAAGAVPYLVWNMLGLEADALTERLVIRRPTLPASVSWLRLEGVRVGRATVDLRFSRRDGGVVWDGCVRDGRCELRAEN